MKKVGHVSPQEAADRDLLTMVRSDLLHIRQTALGDPSADDLRRLSSQLRSLVVDGKIAQAWRTAGLHPKDHTVLARIVSPGYPNAGEEHYAANTDYAYYAIRHQISEPTTTMAFGMEFLEGVKEYPMQAHVVMHGNGTTVQIPFSEYADSPVLFFLNKKVKRRQLIQYVANKRGGNHLDAKRDKKDEEIFSLLDKLEFPTKFEHSLDDPGLGRKGGLQFLAGDKTIVMQALLAIVEELGFSQDLMLLVEKIAPNGQIRD